MILLLRRDWGGIVVSSFCQETPGPVCPSDFCEIKCIQEGQILVDLVKGVF